ncbi:MAG: restriction endonuclease subunit S [Planctomycetes bacterium]|jgi:type I restriction enzyme S subunit|nr:restriction endonuclease subunit S [Planctomycetota bacterium]MCC7061741.1 restriction endonuclease subunit S [Planctomycetota bacterium]
MAVSWRESTWGAEVSLEYGKALRGHSTSTGKYRVFGSNGAIGWTNESLADGPGVILGRKGAYRGVEYSREPFFVIDTAYYVVPKTPTDMRWLFYAIKHHKLGEIDDGSPIPSTTRAAVYVKNLMVPSIEEQRAIAGILGTLDDKIELNRRTNETLEAMASALFKSWFVDFDPVRAKAAGKKPSGMDAETAALFPSELVESEMGDIPKGWPLGSLGTVMELKRGYDLPQGDRREGQVPIVSSGGHSGFHHEAMARAPGIVTGRYGTIGRVFLVREDFWPLNTTLYVRDLKGSDVFFAYHLLQTIDFRKFSDKAAVPGVNRNDLHEEPVIVPPRTVQAKFGEIAALQINLTSTNKSQTAVLAQIRDALLPRLLSGELTIPNAERIAGIAR